jgi:hypothetical protein
MYSFLQQTFPHTVANLKETYEFFVYKKRTPFIFNFKDKTYEINKGTKFGVCPSSNDKFINLIIEGDSKVLTITYEQAQKLSKAV